MRTFQTLSMGWDTTRLTLTVVSTALSTDSLLCSAMADLDPFPILVDRSGVNRRAVTLLPGLVVGRAGSLCRRAVRDTPARP